MLEREVCCDEHPGSEEITRHEFVLHLHRQKTEYGFPYHEHGPLAQAVDDVVDAHWNREVSEVFEAVEEMHPSRDAVASKLVSGFLL